MFFCLNGTFPWGRYAPDIMSCFLDVTALRDSSKRSINSDWKIELPGEFELAGTTVRYVRRGLWEKMSARGPTKTPLHLMVKSLALAKASPTGFLSTGVTPSFLPFGGGAVGIAISLNGVTPISNFEKVGGG